MPDPTSTPDAPPGPYAATATRYHAAGWAPLPLPHGRKTPVPTGYTGARGTNPSYADIHAWTEGREAAGNIALRLPPDVIGIDVDHYGDKPGGAVLAMLEQQLGTLPPTWRSTSRDDGVSGILLFRVPPGLHWPGGLGPGIDTVRHDHRYALTWPSIHPAGGTYRWVTPDGATALDAIPDVDDLPALPDAWVTHFTGGELATDTPRTDLSTTQAQDWLTTHGAGVLCPAMARGLTDGLGALPAATSRHDHVLSLTNRLLWRAAAGHTGLTDALTQIRAAFLAATAGDRTDDEAAAEWDRMIVGGIRRADPHVPNGPRVDPCTDPFHHLIDRNQPWTSPTPTTPPPPSAASTAPSAASSAPANSSPANPEADAAAPAEEQPATERTSWWPRDPELALDPAAAEPGPEHLTRTDGQHLLYPGRINGILGPSESGKSWIGLWAIVQAVHRGHRCTILDFEDSHVGVTTRLRALGLTPTQIRAHVAYIGPDEPLVPFAPSGIDLTEHLQVFGPTLILVDGVNAAMTLHGLDLISNKDATVFHQRILKPLTIDGATVVYIDHTPKDKENNSSGGIGAQAKRAMTSGCALRVSPTKPFGKGQSGRVQLYVDKDRQGDVRGASVNSKHGHWAAEIIVESDGERLTMRVDPPAGAEQDGVEREHQPVRLTGIMEKISRVLDGASEPLTGRGVIELVGGNKDNVTHAMRTLLDEGYVTVSNGPKRAILHTAERSYRQADDPRSDRFTGPVTPVTPSDPGVTPGGSEVSDPNPPPSLRGVGSLNGGSGRTSDPASDPARFTTVDGHLIDPHTGEVLS